MISFQGVGGIGASEVGQRKVDWTRQIARKMLERPQPLVELVYEIVREQAEEAMGAAPAGPDLRGWQSLATDLASALRPHDVELAERMRLLAGRLRALVGLMARVPTERLAVRPTSRRVLAAIIELGGAGCTLADVREHTGLSQSHMSNVVRALAAHGFIKVEADVRDGRGRRLSVTSAGRTAMGRAEAHRKDRFDVNLTSKSFRRQRGDAPLSYDPAALLALDRMEMAE